MELLMTNIETDIFAEQKQRMIAKHLKDYKQDILDKLLKEANKDFDVNADMLAMLHLKNKLYECGVPIDLCHEVASKTNIVVSEIIAEDSQYVDAVISALARYMANHYKFVIKHGMSNQIFLNLVEGMSLMLIPPDMESE
jgi:hypothetical protein